MTDLQELAKQHLMLHFSDMTLEPEDIPVIVRGEGCHIYDDPGNRYIDGLSRPLLHQPRPLPRRGDRRRRRARRWRRSRSRPTGRPRTRRRSSWRRSSPSSRPTGFERAFFTSGGSEAVESAYKLAVQWHQANGEPQRRKVIARRDAYHGISLGALSFTGIPVCRTAFEPLPIPTTHVSSTNAYRHPAGRRRGRLHAGAARPRSRR